NTAGYITGTTNTDPDTNKITGIVTATGATITIDQVIASIILPILPEDEVDAFKEKVIKLVVTTIQNSYQLQQQTLNQQLASLYNISPSFIHALKSWGKLTLVDLLLIQDNDGKEIVNSRLKTLQTYASLITSLALSPAEVQAMVAHPEWFGISATSETRLVFTLQNIQTLYAFKLLIREFGDTENHLLSYFSEASKNNEDLSTEALKLLTTLTQWNAQDIQLLITALEGSSTSAAAIYATVTGIAKLKDYFTLSHQLNIDAFSLVELHNFILANTAEDYESLENIANILWGGLQKEYRSQPDVLVALQGKVDELKRNALLALVISHLRTQPEQPLNIETARDLYEYLLIDVEVSGSVQTSYIKEAISAVQLYLYRCRNHLEIGIEVEEELNTWWPWMEHYRVWQANREVFLYPENYIQPELRTHTTDQFTQLANELQQSNLTASAIDQVVKTYIDGFSEVATLNIVGSYLYTSGSNEQQLYLVGRTTTKPYTYYYRTATLFHADNKYTAVWTPWVKIDLQIKSNVVSSVFAFNKLFLFWTEIKQAPSLQDSTGKPTTKQLEATLYYTFYDFNERWTAPQQLMDPI
ncbi:MAG: neuraminidase-like domain-containing protein, partial [Burkholderiales bacterium]